MAALPGPLSRSDLVEGTGRDVDDEPHNRSVRGTNGDASIRCTDCLTSATGSGNASDDQAGRSPDAFWGRVWSTTSVDSGARPQVSRRAAQCAPCRLSTTTPTTIIDSAISLVVSHDSPRSTTPTTAISAVPSPAQIA